LGILGSLCAQNTCCECEENEARQDDFHLPVLPDLPKNRVLAGRRYHTGTKSAGRSVDHVPIVGDASFATKEQFRGRNSKIELRDSTSNLDA
jgi:hypothetical protein